MYAITGFEGNEWWICMRIAGTLELKRSTVELT